ncbi:MAG: N-acetyltransferase [Alphaproteobacteria bacterium]|nr:N-acetyltransferase [Alphaproteobacteria bacterium]
MFDEFPVFNFGDYKLREINARRDAELFYKYINNDRVTMFLGQDSIPTTLSHASAELQYWANLFYSRRSYYWAIANQIDEIIGTAGFNHVSVQHARAELSYDLSPEYWGRGVMINAIFKILEYAFTKLALVRVQATVGQHNLRSIKLLENLSFKREGELASYEKLQGKHYDFYMYALTRQV